MAVSTRAMLRLDRTSAEFFCRSFVASASSRSVRAAICATSRIQSLSDTVVSSSLKEQE